MRRYWLVFKKNTHANGMLDGHIMEAESAAQLLEGLGEGHHYVIEATEISRHPVTTGVEGPSLG